MADEHLIVVLHQILKRAYVLKSRWYKSIDDAAPQNHGVAPLVHNHTFLPVARRTPLEKQVANHPRTGAHQMHVKHLMSILSKVP